MTTLINSVEKSPFNNAITKANEILQTEVFKGSRSNGKIKTGLVKIGIPENLVVVGDLHGDLESLMGILEEIKYREFLVKPSNKIVFLGDYVDRGSHPIEVLHLLCDLKIKYQNSVILMRGNHEAPAEFPFSGHDLPGKLEEYFGEGWNYAYSNVLSLFRSLPLVTVVGNRLLLVHAGPTTDWDRHYQMAVSHAAKTWRDSTTLEELLWNDPRPLKSGISYENSRRLFGKHFGPGISKNCLEITDTRAIIRSHEPCKQFRIDHDNMVMTIFSCGESYPKFEPGYLFISGKQLRGIKNASDLVPCVRKIKSVDREL